MDDSADGRMAAQNCLVSGSTRGIGFHTARGLARRGAHVILIGDDPDHGKEALARITEVAGDGAAHFFATDLSSQDEIRRLAAAVQTRYEHLDVLVNNVGGFFVRRRESVDGIEMTLALNHLSYFMLTGLLLDLLKASAPARIVNVASDAHRRASALGPAGIRLGDLQFEKGYNGVRAYDQSKLANLLFTYELARKLEGSQVTANALHPGFVGSEIYRELGVLEWAIKLFASLFGKSPREGAETSIYLATSPQVDGVSGEYFVDKEPTRSSPASYDEDAARRLWAISEDLTGLSYGTVRRV